MDKFKCITIHTLVNGEEADMMSQDSGILDQHKGNVLYKCIYWLLI